MRHLANKTSCLLILALSLIASSAVPTEAAAQSPSVAPTLIPLSGELRTADNQPRAGSVVLVISLYEAKDDGAPRWVEHQQVALGPTGNYSVQFGATQPEGLPADLFTGAASTRWIGVAVEGEAEQPRVMLLSVPYAAKAAEAETLAGKTANDFVLSSTFKEDLRTVLQEEGVTPSADDVGTLATVDSLQKSDGTPTGLVDSAVFEIGGNVGIGTTSPQTLFHLAANANLPSIRLQNTEGTGATWQITSSNTGQFRLTEVGTAVRMAIDKTTGNVGIGTGAPAVKFHLAAGGTLPSIRLENTEVGSGGATWQLTSANTGQLRFTEVGAAVRMALDKTTGNLGIGTAAPTSKLHVVGTSNLEGNTTITGTATVSGDMTVNGNIAAKYQDVAEWVDSAEPLEAGSLVVIDQTATNRVTAARKAYDARVAGAVSPQPGLILGEPGEGRVLVAQSGRVKVKADARNGAIRPGDLLVSSPTKGHVMRSRPVKIGGQFVHRPGTVVGKALEALPKGTGEILVLLTLQ